MMMKLLKEPSTWRGIVLLLTGIFGLSNASTFINATQLLGDAKSNVSAVAKKEPEPAHGDHDSRY